jgi:hypothetical protein
MAIKDELLEINEILQQWLEGGMTEEEAMRHIIVVVAKQLTSMKEDVSPVIGQYVIWSKKFE